MGVLDAKIDKQRTFELLRKKNVARVVIEFSGGHDEGGPDSITLYREGETEDDAGEDFLIWYCGGYSMANGNWEPISKPANEDEELSELLQGPIDATFGSWDSVPSSAGILVWDVAAGTATLTYEADEPAPHLEVF